MASSSIGKRSGSSSGNSSRTCLTASMSPIYVQEEQQKEEDDYNSESEEEGEADMSPESKFEWFSLGVHSSCLLSMACW